MLTTPPSFLFRQINARACRKMSLNLSPQEEEVIKIISPIKFHRLFTLPATENHGPLKVSYSIAGPEDGDVPTILLVGGMAHTRWYNIWNEHLAQKEGVRILCIDRLVSLQYSINQSQVTVSPSISRDTPLPNPFAFPSPKLTPTDPVSAPQLPSAWTNASPSS